MCRGRRPLREVVSWNRNGISPDSALRVDLFVRSWVEIRKGKWWLGCNGVDLFVRSWVEIRDYSFFQSGENVDLFVRSWVEIIIYNTITIHENVDLFVRSWVEIFRFIPVSIIALSTSSWGRELKCGCWEPLQGYMSRPLREVVSWNSYILCDNITFRFSYGKAIQGKIYIIYF